MLHLGPTSATPPLHLPRLVFTTVGYIQSVILSLNICEYQMTLILLQLTLQVQSGDKPSGDEQWGNLHHQLGVGQPFPGPQGVGAQHRYILRHEHTPIGSESRKQNFMEVPSMDATSSTAVLHQTDLGREGYLISDPTCWVTQNDSIRVSEV